MRSLTRAYVRVSACRFHAVCSSLGNQRPETKTRGSREREKKGEEEGTEREKKKKSKDRSVARIGFKTVSNDTGQDMTATVIVPGILLPSPASSFFAAPKSLKMELRGSQVAWG